jgi:hypothetical protein
VSRFGAWDSPSASTLKNVNPQYQLVTSIDRSKIQSTLKDWELALGMSQAKIEQGRYIPEALNLLNSSCELSTVNDALVHELIQDILIDI